MRLHRFYDWLIRLHPALFRVRHGDEMRAIFEESDANLRWWLLRDAAVSVVRQRFVRTQDEGLETAVTVGGPQFLLVADERPSSPSLIHGGFMTVALWLALASLMTYGASRRRSPKGLAGSGRGNPHIAATVPGGESTAAAQPSLMWDDPLFALLDEDSDGRLNWEETLRVSWVLHNLDRNLDGSITAFECGVRSSLRLRLRRWVGASVFEAIDRDANGVVSGAEASTGALSLRALDGDGDGSVSKAEVEAYRRQ